MRALLLRLSWVLVLITRLSYADFDHVEEWVKTSPPSNNTKSNRFHVYAEQGVVLAREGFPKDTVSSITFAHGVFVGLDNGEWGGGLFYLPSLPGIPPERFSNYRIADFLQGRDGLFALAMGNMETAPGARILKVVKDPKRIAFSATNVVSLPFNPISFIEATETHVLILCSEGILLWHRADTVSRVYESDNAWKASGPVNAIVLGQSVYIGMRGFVVKLQFDSQFESVVEKQWLAPKRL